MNRTTVLDKAKMIELIKQLTKVYPFASVLGCDHRNKTYFNQNGISRSGNSMDYDFGYVVKIMDGEGVFEYSCDSIDDVSTLVKSINEEMKASKECGKSLKHIPLPKDEPIDFNKSAPTDLRDHSETEYLEIAKQIAEKIRGLNPRFVMAASVIEVIDVKEIFVSPNRVMEQDYCYGLVRALGVYFDNGQKVFASESAEGRFFKELGMDNINFEKLLKDAINKSVAKPIVPGVYDIITSPSMTGIIAHEAFGHGVEMDQFVKDRALGKEYIGKPVASPIVSLRDGALSRDRLPSYFFDCDGVLAHDTLIIDHGILKGGICDQTSALQLNGYKPTGNGRRETHSHKIYTRMTNTIIDPGESTLDEMIKSIKHGYFIVNASNGMEDPKNWSIQCVGDYAIEIVDGKLTENYVAPVVMSGYVPDLLMSISMISKAEDEEVSSLGFCGKGAKEWVRVSDGGTYVKARVKLS